MDIRITGNNVSISAALKSYTERRLRTAAGDAVPNEVEVRLSDLNGPRGGVDKECAVRAVLRRAGVVFVRARGEDAYSTVDKAAGRLRSALAHRLGRHRSTRRRSAVDSRERRNVFDSADSIGQEQPCD
jgi:ribosome-associated translation inhibitor RaiA